MDDHLDIAEYLTEGIDYLEKSRNNLEKDDPDFDYKDDLLKKAIYKMTEAENAIEDIINAIGIY